jgi:hypothetical protein
MDKKIVGVIGAITGLAVIDQAQAAPVAAPAPDETRATSYAALLDPIPNAVEALRAAEAAAAGGRERQMQLAGMKHHHHHSHHHHHHRVKAPPKTHDHHHHHHHHFST